jgi:hypothetical protein
VLQVVIGPVTQVASQLSESLLELAFKVVRGGRGDGSVAERVDEIDEVLAVGEKGLQPWREGSGLGGCQQGGKEDRVIHGGVLSRACGNGKNSTMRWKTPPFKQKKKVSFGS